MSTWPNLEEMRRGMTLMRQGNPYFAWQYVKGNDAPYRPCHNLTQLQTYENDIFMGNRAAGFYAIRPDNLTRWGALDFDCHGTVGKDRWHSKAEAAFKGLQKEFDECWFLNTHPGGFHVSGFMKDVIQAKEIRGILKSFAPEGIEVFPKQDCLGEAQNSKGNLLRFPGKHQLKGYSARFLDRWGQISNVDQVASIENKKWQEPNIEEKYRSFYFAVTRGLEITRNGQRFNAMQKLAGRLKGRVDEVEASKIYTAWHNRYASRIKTPFDESRLAFLSWFRKAEPCVVEIPDYELTLSQKARIANLSKITNTCPETLKAVARIFFRVKKHADHKQVEHPFLSCRTIAEELGISIATASRYRKACETAGLVRVIKMGHTGMASTYEIIE